MCDLFDDLLSFRKRKDEKCQKKTTKKAAVRQPFRSYFMRFGETQSKDQSATEIISSEQLRQQQPEKQRPEQQQRLQSQQNRFRGCLCCHRLCHPMVELYLLTSSLMSETTTPSIFLAFISQHSASLFQVNLSSTSLPPITA